MNNPDTIMNSLRDRFESPSQFSLYALVALIALLAFTGVTSMSDAVSSSRIKNAELTRELLTLEDLEARTLWTTRARTTADAQENWHDLLWSAASPGIAATEVNATLRELSEFSGMLNANIRVDPVVSNRDGVDVLRFEITGGIASSQLPRLLVSLAVSRRKLISNNVRITTRNRTLASIQISGVAPYLKSSDQAE